MSDAVVRRYKEALQQGHVAVVRGRPQDAIEHYRGAAALAPDRPLAYVSMGNVHLQMHQPKDALAAFDEALQRAPSDHDALLGRALALDALGHPEEAAASRRLASELASEDRAGRQSGRPAREPLASLERHVANGAAAHAIGNVDVAVMAYLAAARGYAGMGLPDAAIDACLRALEARPGHIDVHFILALLYLRRGWAEHGQQRVMLLERRLGVDDDPRRRAALHALARDFRSLGPDLEQLAATRD